MTWLEALLAIGGVCVALMMWGAYSTLRGDR